MIVRKSPTIRDVAAAAGVSTATVSKYINRQQTFSTAVEAKLKSAIEELGYRQNPMARSMVTGKTGSIGLTVMDIGNPHYANLVKGANRVALAKDYNLLIVDLEENTASARHLLEALLLRTDGLAVSGRIPQEATEWLAESGKPVVFFGRPAHEGVVSVDTDSHLAASMLARYLVQQGYSRAAYAGFGQAAWNPARLKGLQEVFDEAGGELVEYDVGEPVVQAGERAAARILLGQYRPEVVIGCNDLVAIGLMTQARALGLRIPEDVAIAGFDDIPPSRYVSPALTTVDMRGETTGEAVLAQVVAMIEGREVPHDRLLEPLLVVRDSARRRNGDQGR
ncbi:LacI family DNA-binding transcriptional regulator [Consotaella aegiceratis]|uniref:LacI family DNA-binding transcriptional regulator n=1 Tax=Consotaella aegiceratis TaxID=3097961 RepID=UPI002F414AE0